MSKKEHIPVAAYASIHCLDMKSVHILEWRSYFLLGHTWTDWQFLSILMRSMWWKDQTFPLLQHYLWKQRDQIEFLDGYWLPGSSYDCHSGQGETTHCCYGFLPLAQSFLMRRQGLLSIVSSLTDTFKTEKGAKDFLTPKWSLGTWIPLCSCIKDNHWNRN